MCGVIKLICLLACLLVVPATSQAQQDRRKGSDARCRKPCFQEILKKLDKNGQGIYEVRKEVKANGQGIYEVKKEVKENGQRIYEVEKEVKENGQRIEDVKKIVKENGQGIYDVKKEVKANGQGISEVKEEVKENAQGIKDVRDEVKENGQGIYEVKEEVKENGENIQLIISLIKEDAKNQPCGYAPRVIYEDTFSPDFSASNVLSQSNPEERRNYWVTGDGKKGEHARFVLDFRCEKTFNLIQLVNTINGGLKDRGTKEFSVKVSKSYPIDQKQLNPVLTGKLEDSKNQENPLPLEQYEIPPNVGRYVQFEILSFYRLGGGLQFFNILNVQ